MYSHDSHTTGNACRRMQCGPGVAARLRAAHAALGDGRWPDTVDVVDMVDAGRSLCWGAGTTRVADSAVLRSSDRKGGRPRWAPPSPPPGDTGPGLLGAAIFVEGTGCALFALDDGPPRPAVTGLRLRLERRSASTTESAPRKRDRLPPPPPPRTPPPPPPPPRTLHADCGRDRGAAKTKDWPRMPSTALRTRHGNDASAPADRMRPTASVLMFVESSGVVERCFYHDRYKCSITPSSKAAGNTTGCRFAC